MLAAILLLATGTVDEVEQVSARVAKNLLQKNWAEFRKDACLTFSVEEYHVAYDQYFTKDADKMGYLSNGKSTTYIENTEVLSSGGRLPTAKQKVFDAFCGLVKESRAYSGPGWEWPSIYGNQVTIHRKKFPGPGCQGRIASNAEWGILFAKVDGKWKAQRLILVSH